MLQIFIFSVEVNEGEQNMLPETLAQHVTVPEIMVHLFLSPTILNKMSSLCTMWHFTVYVSGGFLK